MIQDIRASLRMTLGTLAACAVLYPGLLLLVAHAVVPGRAGGSLERDDSGVILGSRLIAQGFARPEYLWPRPSAASYDASAARGSNLAPSNAALTARAKAQVDQLVATATGTVPGELVAASGSGLDPDITLAGALYQVERIAVSRRVAPSRVEEVLRQQGSAGTPWSPPLVNVLEANLALDRNLGSMLR
jgi:potassium-transporting ATPase KdpC subunit